MRHTNKGDQEKTHLSPVDHSLYAFCAHHMHSTSKRKKCAGHIFHSACECVFYFHAVFYMFFLENFDYFEVETFFSAFVLSMSLLLLFLVPVDPTLSIHIFAHCSLFLHYLYRARRKKAQDKSIGNMN